MAVASGPVFPILLEFLFKDISMTMDILLLRAHLLVLLIPLQSSWGSVYLSESSISKELIKSAVNCSGNDCDSTMEQISRVHTNLVPNSKPCPFHNGWKGGNSH